MTSRHLLAVVAAAIAVLVLAACAPHASLTRSAGASPTHRTSSPTPTPSATPTGLAAGVLLRITAVATTPDGTAAKLVLTATDPSDGDGSEPAAMTAAQCDDAPWQTDVPAPRQWIRMTLQSTVPSGTAWSRDISLGVWTGSGIGWQAWTGAWSPFEAYCDTGLATVPGTAQGLMPVGPTASTTDRTSWLFGPWGFEWMADAPLSDRPPFTFTRCAIELGPAAQPYASTLTRTPAPPGEGPTDTCEFGPAFR